MYQVQNTYNILAKGPGVAREIIFLNLDLKKKHFDF